MISALRWAAMRAILMFLLTVRRKVAKTAFIIKPHVLKRAEAESNPDPFAYQPNGLRNGPLSLV